jgi:hypothetical protein
VVGSVAVVNVNLAVEPSTLRRSWLATFAGVQYVVVIEHAPAYA